MKSFRQIWKQIGKLGQFIAIFTLCSILTVACGTNRTSQPNTNTPNPNTTAGNDRITIGTTLKPRTLDPADIYDLAGLNIAYNVGESLYTYEFGKTAIKPLLATEMPKVSADGLTYTIPLRQGVTFHDGTPFNAKAMEFSLQRFIENGGKPSFLLADIIKNVKATADYELTIQIKQPFAAFPSILATPTACAVSPKAYAIGTGKFNPNQLIGTGAYKLTEFGSNDIKLEANDKYWGEKPTNKGINIQIFAGNSANLLNSFRTGAVDIAYQSLDPEQIKNLLEGGEKKQWQTIEAPGTVVNYMTLNVQQEPLKKLEVRQAVASLIDRSLIIDRVLRGQAEPLYSLVPTSFDVSKPSFSDSYGEVNPNKAKELLEKAGFSATNPVSIQVWHSSGSLVRGIVAKTLQAYAKKELGGLIDFEPQTVESASFFSNLSKGTYPTTLADWYPDFLDADNYVQPFLSCSKGSIVAGCTEGASQSRGSFYWSDRANQLIEQQRKEQDTTKRKQIFAELQDLLARDVPYIPLWQIKEYAFAQNGVEGTIINPSQNFAFWKIVKK
jgi:peptide/nickel transport system substrate-binding protein